MYLPKVRISYAYPLDNEKRGLFAETKWREYPEFEKINETIVELRVMWSEVNKDDKIIKALTDIFGFAPEWDIEAFVIGDGVTPMSQPLIISIQNKDGFHSIDRLIEILIHEICHLFAAAPMSNEVIREKAMHYFDDIFKEYSEQTPVMRHHLIVHAVLIEIYSTLFDSRYLSFLRRVETTYEEYRKSFEEVERIGPKKVIEKYREYFG